MYAAFKQYLQTLKLSPVSRKLYLSDVRNFLHWLSASKAPNEVQPRLDEVGSPSSYTKYLDFLRSQAVAPSMLKRTLASLKQFGSFLAITYSLENPMSNFSLTRESTQAFTNQIFLNYIKHFTNYLTLGHLSPLTIKSYKSDITRYLDWCSTNIPSTKLAEVLTDKNIKKYLNYLADSGSSLPSTIERKEKSIARFKDWFNNSYPITSISDNNVRALNSAPLTLHSRSEGLPHSGSVSSNLSSTYSPDVDQKIVKNNNYRKHKLSLLPYFTSRSARNFATMFILMIFAATLGIFGYHQFSRDVSFTAAFPSTPVTPNRQLSFQGRLENAAGTPITVLTPVTFKLFDDLTAGNQLYTTGSCNITPDSDGVFSTQIGSTCGSPIASSVFTENANVWLEVTVDAETLAPRQPIASVAYALNSETLQGFPISSTVSAIRNTVVPMNQWGEIIVGEQSPRLTGVSGTFQISAPSISITTATGTNGNITLAPDGTGQVNIQGNTTSTNFFNVSNAQLTTGSLITGTVANNNVGFKLIDLLSGASPTSKFSVSDAGNTTIAGSLTLSPLDCTAFTNGGTLTTNGSGVVSCANDDGGSGSSAFADLTSGTNSTAAMVIGTGASLNFSGSGTINASTLLGGTWAVPGTIGSTTPNTAAFTTLSTTSTASVSGNLTIGNGSFIQPAYGPLTLAYKSGLNAWTAGLTLQDTTGNVGIGVTNPTSKLEIGGTSSTISNSSGNITIDSFGGSIVFGTDDDLIPTLGAGSADLGSAALPWDNLYTGSMYFAGGTTYYVDASGNAKFLDIIAADSANPGITVGNSTNGQIQIGDSTITDNNATFTLDSPYTSTTIADDLTITGGDLITGNTTSTLFDTVATTLSVGGAATTALNLGNGTGNYTVINLGSNTGTHTINIAGTGATAADTINIGTGGTVADTITIGSTLASTALALNDDNWNITGAGLANFVSVGATTPGTGAFTTLTTSNTASVSGTLTVGNGTTNSIRSPYGPLQLAYKSALDTWTTGLTLQDTTGNVGIGTTTPVSKLNVVEATVDTQVAQFIINNTAANIGLALANTDISANSLDNIRFQLSDTSSNLVGAASITVGKEQSWTSTLSTRDSYMAFTPLLDGSNNEAMRITSSGNVGIGTTTPGAPLEIAQSSTEGIRFSRASHDTVEFGLVGSNRLRLQNITDATELVSIMYDSGNVGIGTSSPTNILSFGATGSPKVWIENSASGAAGRPLTIASGGTVTGSADIAGGNLILQAGLGTGAGVSDIFFQNGTTSSGTALQTMSTKMTIKGTGNVGIGTTGPGSALNIVRTASADDVLLLQDSSGTCEAQPTTTGLTWSCSSDARLKTNITSPSSTLDYIANIPLKDYTVIKTGEYAMGPIAQEIQLTYPELVHVGDDGYLQVSELTPWQIVKGIQELKSSIEAIMKTNLISPLPPGRPITISHNPSPIYDPPSTSVDPLLIVDGELTAATISARLARLNEIEADVANINHITAKNIVADTISANHIEGLDAKLATLSAQMTDSELTSITDRIKARLALLTGNVPTAADIPVPQEATASQTPNVAEGEVGQTATSSASLSSASIDFATINNYLAVIGQATITTLDITANLYANNIQSKDGLLAIQPTGIVNLGSNTLIVDSTGQVMINGDLTVSGKIIATELDLGILHVLNEQGQAVATIDASGSANLASLTTNMITIASPAIASESAGLAELLGTTQSNATAGQAILISPNTELIIESPYITPNSLVYLTPTSNSDNKVLFIKSKESCTSLESNLSLLESCTPSFTVGIDLPASSDISFNWWIIELKP